MSVVSLFGIVFIPAAVITQFFSPKFALRLITTGVLLVIVGYLPIPSSHYLIAAFATGVIALILVFLKSRTLGGIAAIVALVFAVSWLDDLNKPVTWSPGLPSSTNHQCNDVTFFGVRGSGESFDTSNGYGIVVGEMRNLLVEHFTQIGVSFTDAPIDYPALPLFGSDAEPSFIRDWREGTNNLLDGVWLGAETLVEAIRITQASCGATRIVLAGYSQGALVIRLALQQLTISEIDTLYAVDLFADPVRTADTPQPSHFSFAEGAPTGNGVLFDPLFDRNSFSYRVTDFPHNENFRSWCRVKDPFCDYHGLASLSLAGIHTSGYLGTLPLLAADLVAVQHDQE